MAKSVSTTLFDYDDCRNIVQIVNFQVFIFTPGIQSSPYSDHGEKCQCDILSILAPSSHPLCLPASIFTFCACVYLFMPFIPTYYQRLYGDCKAIVTVESV